MQYHDHEFFQQRFTGSISARIMDSAKYFEEFFADINEKLIRKIIAIITTAVALYYVNQIFAIIFTTWLVIFTAISITFSSKANKYSKDFAYKRSIISGCIVDVISNIKFIRLFSSYKYENKYINHNLKDMVAKDQKVQLLLLGVRYLLGFSLSCMIVFMMYYLCKLYTTQEITVGDCVLVLNISTAIAEDMWDLGEEIGDIFEDYGAFTQINDLLVPHKVCDKKDAPELKISNAEIKFRNVVFNYNDREPLFKNKSIAIPSRQKVGLVGLSGSGKTTFISLISRLYDISSGEILIDNQNIANVTLKSLRSNINFVPQEPVLFHRSIKENILYGNFDVSEEEMINVAKKVHLHEVIMKLPLGYETICQEGGSSLSGGQRQRIIIARAILRNAPILVLDEPTSSLDSLTEKYVQESLNILMQGKTALIVAHKLTTLTEMDRILVFDNGKIVDDGKHDDLIKNPHSLYAKLWNSQVSGFLSS